MTEPEKKLLKATHTGKLKIGTLELPCHVLTDRRRVLSTNGVLHSLDVSKKGQRNHGGDPSEDQLTQFLGMDSIKTFVSKELTVRIKNPICFAPAHGGRMALGYEATILPEICDAILDARKAATLQAQQLHIADQCEVLIRAFARVGIVALVDEATGFQDARANDELHRLLEIYIAKELLPWTKKFPDEFYKHLFRLRRWPWPMQGNKTPRYVGKLTNDIVYKKLPIGVLDELRVMNPIENGQRKHKFHQFLTPDVGNDHLTMHLRTVVAMMRGSRTWGGFVRVLNRAFPGSDVQLDLLDE